ncbi:MULTISPECIES: ABC transporter ATP-binding protein [unclassified Spirosoma]|uniref:ABC transporter ATP-binding protein n=1 Tax=unclassified Spirosoma TaxID=2621999 RepID=UPI00095CD746|nr:MULTISPECIES: ABC transporter ATP-binding protein [unclassified Spirosoma]MBN8824653.1 ABC transporter ATP-binding protein [Spirosoma sp.]OJW78795.1 MAG: multidrug ABC transporter ATP-binding protein [Spirosoma sp. 48-14]
MQLEIKDLTKTYSNGVRALKGVSLTIPQGMFGLLGPNGAGKSSLMRTIATLQEADGGSARLTGLPEGDLDILTQKDAVRRLLGYLPQEFGVYPRVTAEAMLDHIATLKGIANSKERKEIVQGLLQKVNLYEVRKKNLGTYSGGMKQRFGIAQALIGSPRLIIVDEPTAGLDPAERNRFHNLLSEIGENTIVILSTHIVEDVTNLCSDMAIICLGEVVATGNPNDLVTQLNGKVWQKSVEKSEIDTYRQTHQIISTQLKGGKTRLHAYSEVPLDGFTPVTPDLEDVYFTKITEKMGVMSV